DDEEFLERMAKPLRAPVELSAGFEARVMAAARNRESASVLAWITRPRVLRLSPLAGLAAAAGIALAVLTVERAGSDRVATQIAATAPGAPVAAADTIKLVQFMLVAPEARTVSLVGDFNDWDSTATPLREAADAGVWTITVPLSAGRHQYVFMVDGNRWTPDPAAPVAVEDDFGMPNSVITVGESAT
ncbi:MAG: isoamylase early set domain-containing protein, partial [Gemmatimonadaceae bacterium]|nr:isoamylase early set domain-containing protein [Gemmatimonadaceae bacterium]